MQNYNDKSKYLLTKPETCFAIAVSQNEKYRYLFHLLFSLISRKTFMGVAKLLHISNLHTLSSINEELHLNANINEIFPDQIEKLITISHNSKVYLYSASSIFLSYIQHLKDPGVFHIESFILQRKENNKIINVEVDSKNFDTFLINEYQDPSRAYINNFTIFSLFSRFTHYNYSRYDSFKDAVLIINEQKKIIYANLAASSLIGISIKELLKKYCYDHIHFSEENLFCMPKGMKGYNIGSGLRNVKFHTKQSSGNIQISIEPLLGAKTHWQIYLHKAVIENSESKQKLDQHTKQEMQQIALTDALTNLPNFRHFEKKFHKVWETERYTQFGLVICDIDHFKNLNDSYGHKQGDEVLRSFARTVNATLRDQDFVARYSGEKFLFLFPNISMNQLDTVCERLRRSIEECKITSFDGDNKLSITSSLGGSIFYFSSTEKPELETLIHKVDVLLYEAKANGKNCYILK